MAFIIFWDVFIETGDVEERWFLILEIAADSVIIFETLVKIFYLGKKFWVTHWVYYVEFVLLWVSMGTLALEVLVFNDHNTVAGIYEDTLALRFSRQIIRFLRLLLFIKWFQRSLMVFMCLKCRVAPSSETVTVLMAPSLKASSSQSSLTAMLSTADDVENFYTSLPNHPVFSRESSQRAASILHPFSPQKIQEYSNTHNTDRHHHHHHHIYHHTSDLPDEGGYGESRSRGNSTLSESNYDNDSPYLGVISMPSPGTGDQHSHPSHPFINSASHAIHTQRIDSPMANTNRYQLSVTPEVISHNVNIKNPLMQKLSFSKDKLRSLNINKREHRKQLRAHR